MCWLPFIQSIIFVIIIFPGLSAQGLLSLYPSWRILNSLPLTHVPLQKYSGGGGRLARGHAPAGTARRAWRKGEEMKAVVVWGADKSAGPRFTPSAPYP